jgi:hypothetical protein
MIETNNKRWQQYITICTTLELLVGNLVQLPPICKHFETIYCAEVAPSNPPHAEKQHNITSYPFPSIMPQIKNIGATPQRHSIWERNPKIEKNKNKILSLNYNNSLYT